MTVTAQVLATFGKLPAYAVLDGARDGRVGSLAKGELARCLYRGTLTKELNEAAPHLMRVWAGSEPTERYFSQGWRDAWGVLLAYTGPIKILYRHLRQFLRVRGEDGKLFAFRFYDPRVLRVYLPTCTPAEMERFFGPIEAFAVEDEDPGAFHLFRRLLRGFEHRRISRTDRRLRTWDQAEPPDRDGPLTLFRARQLAKFQALADARYAEQMLRFLRKRHGAAVAGLSHDEIRRRCRDALNRASGYGLSGDAVFSFVTMAFTVSPAFDAHPRFQSILADPELPAREKMPALLSQVSPSEWAAARGMR